MYKIEIWQYHSISDEFSSDNLEEVKKWYFINWCGCYNSGGCTFYIYHNGEEKSELNEEFW